MITGFFQFMVLVILFWMAVKLFLSQPAPVRPFFWPALIFKLAAGLLLGYLYFYYYRAGDTITYWQDGKLIADRLQIDPISTLRFLWNDAADPTNLINDKPRSVFFVKIAGLLAFISFGNYWVMTILIAFVSFLPGWYLFRKIVNLMPVASWSASIAFLFFPSVIFWSSGLIKESLGLGSLFFLTGIFLKFYNREKIRIWEWVVASIALWIGWNLKYYWIGVFLPVVVTTGVVIQWVRFQPSMKRWEGVLWFGILVILLSLATSIHPNFYPHRILEVIVGNNQEFMRLTDSDNIIHYRHLEPTFQSVLWNAPQALIAGIFRPFIWESYDMLSCIAGLENLLVLLVMATSIPFLGRILSSPHRLLSLAVLIYSFLLAVFLALSTPNFGTLSRYRIGFLPFLIFVIINNNTIIEWLLKRRVPDHM